MPCSQAARAEEAERTQRLQQELAIIKQQLADADAQRAAWDAEAVELRSQVAAAKAAAADAEAARVAAVARAGAADGRVCAIRAAHKSSAQLITELQQQLGGAEAARSGAEQRGEALGRQLEAEAQSSHQLQQQLAAAEAALVEERRRSAVQQHALSAEAYISNWLRQQLGVAEAASAEAAARAEQQQQRVAALEQRGFELEQRVTALRDGDETILRECDLALEAGQAHAARVRTAFRALVQHKVLTSELAEVRAPPCLLRGQGPGGPLGRRAWGARAARGSPPLAANQTRS